MLTGKEYLRMHNNALMILAVEWEKETILKEKEKWYNTSWTSGTALEKGGKN